MQLKFKLVLCFIALAQVVGLFLLFLGVVGGLEESHHGQEELEARKNKTVAANLSSTFPDRVILMVIDALRVDMMTKKNFPFLLGSLKNHKKTAVLEYQVTVDSPTVTLPRVKTLLTGKAPTYLDILKNFQTSDTTFSSNQLAQENLLKMLKDERPDVNICFFGDETWLRLFPPDAEGKSNVFKRWEGVTSFFVMDFEEVDKNVTRNIDSIEDCHFVILHYLGLDHIGHVHGPTDRPDLITKKLREMDKVIQRLISEKGDKGSSSLKKVIMVTGDHGMANVGGHGGSSFEEVTTPLVTIITGIPFMKNQKPIQPLINQVDIAPTLSSLWGLRVPEESQGKILLDIVEPFQSSQQLALTYQYNCDHLIQMLGESREASTYRLWLSEISQMEKPLSVKKYIELETELALALRSLKQDRNSVSNNYISGVILLIVVQIILMLLVLQKLSPVWTGNEIVLVLSFVPSLLIYFSSSFIEEEHYIRHFIFSCLILFVCLSTASKDFANAWSLIKILALHRVLFSLNQTGDKWNHLKDVNDYLMKENLTGFTALIGFLLIFRFLRNTSRNSKFCSTVLIITYLTKVLSNLDKSTTKLWPLANLDELAFQKIVYLMIVLNLLFGIYQNYFKTSIFTTLLLLFLHLQRLQNVIVVGLLLTELLEIISFFQDQFIVQVQLRKSVKIPTHLITQIAIVWLAHSAFFYQGNSNGLATVDVSAGYIGVGSFSSSTLIGILIYLNTYGNPIIVYLHFLTMSENSSDSIRTREDLDKSDCQNLLKNEIANPLPVISLISNGAEALVYSMTLVLFQNHLFIWSVFVPKLLYLVSQSVMHFILAFIYLLI